MRTDTDRLTAIRDKVESGQRLSFEDGLALEASNDLFALGSMANLVRERYNGNFTYFNVNTHINPTNVCVYTCDFCAFRADLGEDRAYVMDRDQIVERARQASARGATELHIVGGLHHKLPFGYYLDVVRWIRETAPEIHIKAYTAVEIEWFCKISRKSVEQVLNELIEAGLGSLPGGGAEIFHPEVREQICGAKASTESWLNVHRTAHRLGLHSNATMLYGHIDGPKHRIDHLVRLRELQDETGGFQTFIPLAFHPDNSEMAHIPKPSGFMDLKVMAISRLMLDNFPHIKAYWVMLGLKTAQVALSFGADDLDGTVVHEKIYHEAGAETPQEATVAEIQRLDHRGRTGSGRTRYSLSSYRARKRIVGLARTHRRAGLGRAERWQKLESPALLLRGGGCMSIAPSKPVPADPNLPDHLPDHLELPEENGEFVQNFRELPQSLLLSSAIWPILESIHPDRHFAVGQDSGIYWRLTNPPERGAVAPDWFYVPGVPPDLDGHYRRSYVLWKEHISPAVIIEYASGDGREERDRTPLTRESSGSTNRRSMAAITPSLWWKPVNSKFIDSKGPDIDGSNPTNADTTGLSRWESS